MSARVFTIVVLTALFSTLSFAQLPPISWTCPMHADVLEDKKGTCPLCGMPLEQVRLVTMYTCPVHSVIEQSNPGKCRICARDLVGMTTALSFTCRADSKVNDLEPGKCPDGSPKVAKYTKRAHGDHNPKHGGIFFMAPDNWHHIEGTYPSSGRFRLYVYDDYSRPLSAADARSVRGRIVTSELHDPKTGTTRDLASAPLVLDRSGTFFEAQIDRIALPAKMVAKIAFKTGEQDSRFDFMFPEFSKDFPASGAATPAQPSTPQAARAASVSSGTALTGSPPSAAPAPTAPAPISSEALLADLKARTTEVASLVQAGTLAGVYVPALQAKDIALEIQSRETARSPAAPSSLEAPVTQIVIAAYQLDNFGDLGDGARVQEAYTRLSKAVSDLEAALTGRPR